MRIPFVSRSVLRHNTPFSYSDCSDQDHASNLMNMVVGSLENGRQQQRQVRHRRTRNACERCRAQRRKCDEQKPQCNRCSRAEVECQYATRISFLDKNSRTLSSGAMSNINSSPMPSAYSALRFINSNESIHPSKDVLNQTVLPLHEDLQERVTSHHQPKPRLDVNELSSEEIRERDGQEMDNSWPLFGKCSLSLDESRLLRHYNHSVAPWLDVCDLDRTFGHLILRYAMLSPCVMDAVLQLSAESLDTRMNPSESRGIGAIYMLPSSQPADDDTPLSALSLLANFVLLRAKQFMQAIPDTWTASLSRGSLPRGIRRDDFVDVTQRRLWLCSFSLLARLEIAYELTTQTASAISSDVIREVLIVVNDHGTYLNSFQRILSASLQCLALLGDVMSLCFSSTEQEQIRADNWKALLEKLFEWHLNRPVEIQAFVEMEAEDRESTFPSILFTNTAGCWVTVIYHTAMLLLLSHQPREEMPEDRQSRAETTIDVQMTPLWHARRVCGIALNSDPEHSKCWDPCMIAAFSFAAQNITYLALQNEILSCLDRVRAAGWRIDGMSQRLRTAWDAS